MVEQATTLTAQIERAAGDDGSPINLETGEFPLVLATQGETADGHILNIAGVSAADRIPLQIDHSNSALRTLGSITNIRKSRRGALPILRATGRIEMEGDGEQAAIRRDIANMIARGHLSAISVRARGEKITARTDLPTGHPAHVSNGERNLTKRLGFLFEKSTIQEGSIVALGADKRAIIGRSLSEPVSEFWNDFLAEVDETSEEQSTTDLERDDTPKLIESEAIDFAQVTDVRSLETLLRDGGASRSEAKRIIALCKTEGESSPRDVERPVQVTPTFDVRDVRRTIGDELAGLKDEIARECSQMLSDALGRVNQ